ncbi:anti-sigma factor [Niabella drilacis]|uniref:Uncharacterized protein n=1 Tax=Niabella drilacis (strain DSM 25811 / CCM 8410 / CCUG 62505 / LMG 26954 / E90) TaxID=1285928 RepID=A0A1G6NUV7_NIADE|nr:hypothetical protein [Niabella drilacis]SDC71800.1 hypothetical protein SAMN04487894_103410 [Niabella drilacis]
MQGRIDPTNFEAYFLLYVDNELSSAERVAVEQFLQQHPDMMPLLEALICTRQAADPMIVFPDRSKLLFGTEQVTEEELLSYIDQEAVSAAVLEKLKDPSPELAKRLQAFENTRSEPDMQIVFPDKTRLYRTRRLTAFRKWGMVAAAAVVVIAMGAGVWMTGRQKRPGLAGAEPATDTASQPVIARVIPEAPPPDTVPPAGDTGKNAVAADAATDHSTAQRTAKSETTPAPLLQPPSAIAKSPATVSGQSTTVPRKTDVPLQPETRPAIAKQDPTPPAVAEPDPLTQQAIAAASDEKQPKTKKSLFKKLTQRIEERITETLTDNEDQVTIAGFAVNVK